MYQICTFYFKKYKHVFFFLKNKPQNETQNLSGKKQNKNKNKTSFNKQKKF